MSAQIILDGPRSVDKSHTVVCGRELCGHHRFDHALDVIRMWVPGARVHGRLVDNVERSMAGLEDIESSSHVSLGQLEERLKTRRVEIDPDERETKAAE
jgi:hypothetical protein